MAWGTVSQTSIFPWAGGWAGGKFRGGSVSPIGGTSMWGGASVRGVLSLISFPLEETTHAWVEIEGFRRGGSP
jgi:hypothetical protein